MRQSRFTEPQMIAAIKETESGTSVAEMARRLGVTEQTIYRWKAKFGGMDVSEAQRLKELEEENRRLKEIVAEQTLDLQAVRMVLRKKW